MPSWLSFKQQSLLGIDIGTTGVKLVELARRRKQFELLSYAVVPYANGQFIDPMLPDIETMSAAILEAIKVSGTSSKRVAIAVNGASVITREIEIQSDGTDEGNERAVYDQADQIIPYSLDDVIIDYCSVGEPNPRTGLQPMFIAACRKDQVESQEQLLEAVSLDCRLIDVDTLAIGRALKQSLGAQSLRPEKGLMLLLDIGAMRSVLYAFDDERLVYSREHDFGDKQLREPPAANPFEYNDNPFSYDEESAPEPAKQSAPLTEADRYRETLGNQLQRALELFAEAQPESMIGCLVLAGGGACQQGLAMSVGKHLGIKVHQANPLAGIKRPAKLDAELQQRAPSLMTACGLAMRVGQEWGGDQ
ncbi:type IV pilus biogenesis protein PilM [Pokkaliibacter sp. CJK22405]|uniref:type IV pilus biogenesis protein PilM n=1 Tax=Pokkaliibacter sp. CJK22405 TaxID=3384615 RepID=UPI003984790D